MHASKSIHSEFQIKKRIISCCQIGIYEEEIKCDKGIDGWMDICMCGCCMIREREKEEQEQEQSRREKKKKEKEAVDGWMDV